MATKSEHVVANAVRADSSGIHKIPVEDSTDAASRTVSEPPSQILENGNHGDLPWLLAAVGVVLAAVVGLKYIAPGFLAGLVLGLFLVLLAQAALVWFVWEKVQARRKDSIGHSSVEVRKAESPKPGPELERQASVSNEVRNLVLNVCFDVDPACMQTQPHFTAPCHLNEVQKVHLTSNWIWQTEQNLFWSRHQKFRLLVFFRFQCYACKHLYLDWLGAVRVYNTIIKHKRSQSERWEVGPFLVLLAKASSRAGHLTGKKRNEFKEVLPLELKHNTSEGIPQPTFFCCAFRAWSGLRQSRQPLSGPKSRSAMARWCSPLPAGPPRSARPSCTSTC
jgi:hypothetical protein